jgi:hypothetical protein
MDREWFIKLSVVCTVPQLSPEEEVEEEVEEEAGSRSWKTRSRRLRSSMEWLLPRLPPAIPAVARLWKKDMIIQLYL